MTIHVSADEFGVERPIFETGLISLGDNEFYITTNAHGLYVIKTRGPGAAPKLCEEVFTNLHEARKALDRYQLEHKLRLDMKARTKKAGQENPSDLRKAKEETKE